MDFKALPGVPSHIFPLESRSDKDPCEIKVQRELAETKKIVKCHHLRSGGPKRLNTQILKLVYFALHVP